MGDQGAELLRVVRRVVLRAGQPGPRPRAQHDLRRGRRAAALREPAARLGHVLPPRLPGPDRLHASSTSHLRGHLREPRPTRGRRGSSWRSRRARAASSRCSGQYTLLDGEVLESPSDFDPVYAVGQPLLRRPRHQGSLSAPAGRARAGAPGVTLALVGERADSDFVGLGLTTNPGYARLDARAARCGVAARARGVRGRPTTCWTRSTRKRSAIPRSAARVRGGLRLRLGGGARP